MSKVQLTVSEVCVQHPRHAGSSLPPAGVVKVVAAAVHSPVWASGIASLRLWRAHLRDAGYISVDIFQGSIPTLLLVSLRKPANMFEVPSG